MSNRVEEGARYPDHAAATFRALAQLFEPGWGITWRAVDHTDAALIAIDTGLSVYDASYLWLAASLGADLVTLDARLAGAGDKAGASHPTGSKVGSRPGLPAKKPVAHTLRSWTLGRAKGVVLGSASPRTLLGGR
jgi:hypothetical protein